MSIHVEAFRNKTRHTETRRDKLKIVLCFLPREEVGALATAGLKLARNLSLFWGGLAGVSKKPMILGGYVNAVEVFRPPKNVVQALGFGATV